MQTRPQGARCKKVQIGGDTRIVRFAQRPIKQCRECGGHFHPRHDYHVYCAPCYRGDQMIRAIDAYREAYQ